MGEMTMDKKEIKKKYLLKNALDLFVEKGFHETSLRDIAISSDMTKGGLYHYLQSKDEILFLLHEQFITEGIKKLKMIEKKDVQPKKKFIELLETHLDIIHEYKPDITLFFKEIDKLSDGNYKYIKNKRDEYEEIFLGVLEEGVEQKEFNTINSKVTVLYILGASNFMYQWYNPNGILTIGELKEIYLDIVLNGLMNNNL